MVIREYTVKQGKELKVRDGIVAALQETSGVNKGKVFQGGEHQFEFIDNIRGDNWKDFLTISSKKGITLKLVEAGDNVLDATDIAKLRANNSAHTIERHGFEVTDDLLKRRAIEGIAPDGSSIAKHSWQK